MSDKPEDSTDSIPVTGPATPAPAAATAPTYGPPPVYQAPQQAPVVQKSSRLNKVAALVGIVAGAVVIVAVIFGTGFMLGAHSGRHHGGGGYGHDRNGAMEHRGGPPMFPMMRPGPAFVFPGGPGFQGGGPGFQGGPFENGQGGGSGGSGGAGGSGQGPANIPPTQPGR